MEKDTINTGTILKDAIFSKLKELLASEFSIDAGSISLEKHLEEDLDLDSLDAVDLLISLTDYVEGEPDPALFKDAHTVADMVDLLVPIWKQT